MKTTYITTTAELLELAVRLGFDKERALEDIDACLDETLGFENRKDMSEEVLEKRVNRWYNHRISMWKRYYRIRNKLYWMAYGMW